MSILSVTRKMETSDEHTYKKQKKQFHRSKELPSAILNLIANFFPYRQTTPLYQVCKHWNALQRTIQTFSWDNPLTNSQIAYIVKKCPHLRSLEIYLPNACEKIFEIIIQLPRLTSIKLQGSITVSGLEKLAVLNHLKSIRINSWRKMTNNHLYALTKIKSLEIIDLRNQINIDFEGIKSVVKLKNLKSIDIRFCPQISKQAIASLHLLRLAYDLPEITINSTSY